MIDLVGNEVQYSGDPWRYPRALEYLWNEANDRRTLRANETKYLQWIIIRFLVVESGVECVGE